jgi:hypothetical protein
MIVPDIHRYNDWVWNLRVPRNSLAPHRVGRALISRVDTGRIHRVAGMSLLCRIGYVALLWCVGLLEILIQLRVFGPHRLDSLRDGHCPTV